MQRIAIVDPNEASRESLRTMLLGVDFVWLEAECARYEYFFDVVQQSTPDLAMGDADIAIELPGTDNISMGDLARNIERLDMSFLRRAMAKHDASGLSILRHPLEIADVGLIHEGHVERVLNLLKISYSHLILDLSKSILPTDLSQSR